MKLLFCAQAALLSFFLSKSFAFADGQPLSPREPRKSKLAIPKAPIVPASPPTFLASEKDLAGKTAREIASRIQRFYNFRAQIPGAQWFVDDAAIWSIRPHGDCLETLIKTGIPFGAIRKPEELTTPIPTPVRITEISGVRFRSTHANRDVIVSCELALRLRELVAILKALDIVEVDVMSSYRSTPFTSFHTFGLAVDLSAFRTEKDEFVVEKDFIVTPDELTCPHIDDHRKQTMRRPFSAKKRSQILRDIACELMESKKFSTVITPNYNEGHRDHFHIDARPNDPRLFVR